MATVGQSASFLGLTHRPNKQAQAQADLQTLDLMVQRKKEAEAQEQQAALVEQQYYDRLRQEADKLLAPDRKRINEKAKQVQASVREKIKLFGGSRKKFMANGGLSMIGGYSDQILDSEELATYRANKENMVKLLDIKEKNMGHRLSAIDQANLEAYQRDGSGKVSYSGLMNEIDIPDPDTELFGKKMTAVDIYKYKENFQKLVANYQLEHPDVDLEKLDPDPAENARKLEQKMLIYAHTKGYGGVGNRILPQQTDRTGRNTKGTDATKPKSAGHTVSTSLALINSLQTEKPIDTLSIKDFEQDELISGMLGNTEFKVQGSNDASFDSIKGGGLGGQDYRLRSAVEVKGGFSQDLLKLQYGVDGYQFEGNKILKFKPNDHYTTIYRADGGQLGKGEGIWERDFKVIGTAFAWKGQFDTGPALIVDGVDENGNSVENEIQGYRTEGDNPATAKPTYVVMLKDEKSGSVIYQEIDYSTLPQQTQLSGILEGRNDLSAARDESAEKLNTVNAIKMKEQVRVEGVPTKDFEMDTSIFNEPLFVAQGEAFNPENPTEGRRRHDLRQAYYMASADFAQKYGQSQLNINEAVAGNAFQSALDQLGLKTIFANPNISDSMALDYLEDALNQGETDQELIKQNMIFINMLKGYISNIRK